MTLAAVVVAIKALRDTRAAPAATPEAIIGGAGANRTTNMDLNFHAAILSPNARFRRG